MLDEHGVEGTVRSVTGARSEVHVSAYVQGSTARFVYHLGLETQKAIT